MNKAGIVDKSWFSYLISKSQPDQDIEEVEEKIVKIVCYDNETQNRAETSITVNAERIDPDLNIEKSERSPIVLKSLHPKKHDSLFYVPNTYKSEVNQQQKTKIPSSIRSK